MERKSLKNRIRALKQRLLWHEKLPPGEAMVSICPLNGGNSLNFQDLLSKCPKDYVGILFEIGFIHMYAPHLPDSMSYSTLFMDGPCLWKDHEYYDYEDSEAPPSFSIAIAYLPQDPGPLIVCKSPISEELTVDFQRTSTIDTEYDYFIDFLEGHIRIEEENHGIKYPF